MLRFLLSTPLAIFFSLLMFYSLALITSTSGKPEAISALNPDINFLMLRDESDIETRQRKLPKLQKIEQQQEPKMPVVETKLNMNVDVSMPSIDVPNISMDLDVNLSPSLHNLTIPKPVLTIDNNPKILERFPPRYPQRALRRRQEGNVIVEFTISKLGKVKEGSVVVVSSTPPGVFDKAVLRSIKRWRFQKRFEDGEPIAFKARQELKFKLGQ